MRHLTSIPCSVNANASTQPQVIPGQLRLVLDGVPDRDDLSDLAQGSAPQDIETHLPEIDSGLQAMFNQMDTLFDGLEGPALQTAIDAMYFDADDKPRSRALNLRPVN